MASGITSTSVKLTTAFSNDGNARCGVFPADDAPPTANEVLRGAGAVGQPPAAKVAQAHDNGGSDFVVCVEERGHVVAPWGA